MMCKSKKKKRVKFWFDEGSFTTLEKMKKEGNFSSMAGDKELNLPQEFIEIEKQANRGKRKNCNVIFGSKTIRQLLQALSDARNEVSELDVVRTNLGEILDEKLEGIWDLLLENADLQAEIKKMKDHNEDMILESKNEYPDERP